MFKESFLRLKKPITLTTSAMYIALFVVLYSVKIPLALESRVSFTFLPIAASAYLMGPVSAMIVGGVGDLLGCLLFPQGQYFPGFTISAIVNGLIFAVFLYKADKHRILRATIAVLLSTLFVNLVLNTLWLTIMYQKAFIIYLISRFVKIIIVFPIEIIGTVFCIKLHDRTGITKYYL